MNEKKIILIGGGGHCKACIDVIETTGEYKITGILDLPGNVGKEILGYEITGTDDNIPGLVNDNTLFLITLGQISISSNRKKMFETVKKSGGKLATIISKNAYVSKYSQIGEGTIIMHQTLINANAKIGNNCIINNKALIEHDAVIGDHTHVSTAATVNGECKIGSNCMIGSKAVIKHGISITNNVLIGAGAVVVKDITEPGVYAGVPARKIK